MWHVEKNLEPGRGGFQNRDVGRSSFDRNYGPEYGTDYARYSDPPDYGADAALAENILNTISKSFPQLSSQIEILVKNGFVFLKGPELNDELRTDLVAAIVSLPCVNEIINQIPPRQLLRFKFLKKEKSMNELQDLKEKHHKLVMKIKKIESELKQPLKKDLNANAVEERNREVLNKTYQIEKKNLARIDEEIGKHLV